MGITGREWVDFVVWTTKEMTIERIKFDEETWAQMKIKLHDFFARGVVPELFTRCVQREKPLFM
jgi:hypothetical protein